MKKTYDEYKLPPIDILTPSIPFDKNLRKEEIAKNAETITDTFARFKKNVSISNILTGPRVTRYDLELGSGVKINSVLNLANDIALSLLAEGVRMEYPSSDMTAPLSIEVPNRSAEVVQLRDLIGTCEFSAAASKTTFCLGRSTVGAPIFSDIAKMPHLIVAGATGMGKSVCINSMIASILYKARSDDVKFIMIDPKKVEFTGYNGLPHMLVPVITDVERSVRSLIWAVTEMERRYDLFSSLQARKLDDYNERVANDPTLGQKLPRIIIIIDELNDIMLQRRKPTEDLIMSIAQKSRAAGIHLIIGTQRPSTDVLTGVIKVNIPSRICCKVASYNDSKVVLEQSGAEKLLNSGDMLYLPAGAARPIRVQGAYISESDLSALLRYIKSQEYAPEYNKDALKFINENAEETKREKQKASRLKLTAFLKAVKIVVEEQKASTSFIQRKLNIGYIKAANYIDCMQALDIIDEQREVLITKDNLLSLLRELINELDPEHCENGDVTEENDKIIDLHADEELPTPYDDERFINAVELAISSRKISTSLLQRKLRIGYGAAARLLDMMEAEKIIEAPIGHAPSEVLITNEEWETMLTEKRKAKK